MKRLFIAVQGREIVSGSLLSPVVLVGRSPSCEIVLRSQGVKPVHFLVEWLGEGEFGVEEGAWTVFDISKHPETSEAAVGGSGVGSGLLLSAKKGKLSGFEFWIGEDRLEEADLRGSLMARSLRQKELSAGKGSGTLLEVVSVDNTSDSVTEVSHFELVGEGARFSPLPPLPGLAVRWQGTKGVRIETAGIDDLQVFSRGERVIAPRGELDLIENGVIRIRYHLQDHYFRLVPRIEVPRVKLALSSDSFYRTALITVVTVLLLLYFVWQQGGKETVEVAPPPRIARVEIKNVESAPPPTLQAQPPVAQPMKPVEEPPVEVEKKAAVTKKETVASAAKVIDRKEKASKPSLNSVAPKENVASVGLLGALKKGGTGGKGSVDANKIFNDGIVSKTVSGAGAGFVVSQPPAGMVDPRQKDTKGTGEGGGLAKAASNIQAGEIIDPKSLGALSGDATGREIKIGFDAATQEASEQLVEGGLDKESVRRSLAAYRKEIRTCYERGLAQKPKMSGRIVYNWDIKPDGFVGSINLKSSTIGLARLEVCVMEVIRSIRFPEAPNKRPTKVIYPFEFQARG